MRRILWFRRDLRVEDNPLLAQDGEVFPIFIFDSNILSKLPANDKRVTFIFNTVSSLKTKLQKIGLDLAIFHGNPPDIFKALAENFDEVVASGDYDSYALERDRKVSHLLHFNYQSDTYIFRTKEVLKSDSTPYLVFTPFYNKAKTLFTSKHLEIIPNTTQKLFDFEYNVLHNFSNNIVSKLDISLESIGFVEQTLTKEQLLTPQEKLDIFSTKISAYSNDRDYLALNATSELSIDLRFGTISIREVLRWLQVQKKKGIDTEPFFRQLIFRDFYAMLLYHFPYLESQNFRYKFNGINNNEYYEAFCSAKTGVPIVDAGLRQLLETGEMHNRVRMIVASFFTKNLLLPWQWGEAFFAQHLMDYDASSNILSWQWSAGTGVDPQPYFRIFNPYTQSMKFDKNGGYIKRYVPELSNISIKFLVDEVKLYSYAILNYPQPIVNYKESSKKALEYFKSLTSK